MQRKLSDKNKNEKSILIRKMLAYSAIKIKANPNLPYSILNPDTSSDSPSAKSKGVRLVSAIHEMSQIPAIGTNKMILFQRKFIFINNIKFSLSLNMRKNSKITASLTSYETV